jgi:hypothetical protein
MAIVTGKLMRVTFDDMNTRGEATLEVQHDDESMTYLVVDINRMTERIPPSGKSKRKRRDTR